MSIFSVREHTVLNTFIRKDSANSSTVEPRLSEHLMSPPYLDGRDIWIPECVARPSIIKELLQILDISGQNKVASSTARPG